MQEHSWVKIGVILKNAIAGKCGFSAHGIWNFPRLAAQAEVNIAKGTLKVVSARKQLMFSILMSLF